MHRCLKVTELANMIAEILAEPANDDPGDSLTPCGIKIWAEITPPSALIPFSRTCKHFHRIAIRLLWRRLPDFSLFSLCLPAEVAVSVWIIHAASSLPKFELT